MMISQYSTNAEQRALLSTLWAFVLINTVFRDLHEFFRPGMLFELLGGFSNGVAVTEALLLIGGVLIELQIAMIVLCRVLPNKANTIANISIAIASIVLLFAQGKHDMDDYFFTAAQLAGLGAILWYAWGREKLDQTLWLLAPPVK